MAVEREPGTVARGIAPVLQVRLDEHLLRRSEDIDRGIRLPVSAFPRHDSIIHPHGSRQEREFTNLDHLIGERNGSVRHLGDGRSHSETTGSLSGARSERRRVWSTGYAVWMAAWRIPLTVPGDLG